MVSVCLTEFFYHVVVGFDIFCSYYVIALNKVVSRVESGVWRSLVFILVQSYVDASHG